MTDIRLTNTLTRAKERFEPIDPENVRLYVCGPTVYDKAHIGNARTFVGFDLLYRLLRHLYGADNVTYVRNITDIDDKINERAAEAGISIRELTEETAATFRADMDGLNILRPDVEPLATEHVTEIVEMISTLIEKGHAYEAEGHVLFDVASMTDYGSLSRRDTDDLIAGARVDVAPYKKGPMDFVLWKPSPEDLPGWDSPWGRGRPGWHIECSAMSQVHLGETFDIHGGGIDLVFPHHENEIAQSTCAHSGAPMARYWLHAGFLNMGEEKMSKSLGNILLPHELLKHWPGEALRLYLLTAQYRQPMTWTESGLKEAKTILDRWYKLIAPVETQAPAEVPKGVLEALCDDLNMPKALAEMHDLAGAAAKGDEDAARSLRAAGLLIGIFSRTAEQWFAWRPEDAEIDEAEIERLIEARQAARQARNFAEADRIRDELASQGIALEDGPKGTIWRYEGA